MRKIVFEFTYDLSAVEQMQLLIWLKDQVRIFLQTQEEIRDGVAVPVQFVAYDHEGNEVKFCPTCNKDLTK